MRKFYLFFAFFVLIASSFAQSTDLVPFQDANGKWGYQNGNGEIAIKPQFKSAQGFHEGLAVVCLLKLRSDGSEYRTYGYINISGEIVIDIIYSEAEPFKNGWAKVGKPKQNKNGFFYTGYRGYINKKGEEVIPLIYSMIGEFDDDGLAVACYNGKYGFINKNGETVIDFIFDGAYPFSAGLAVVKHSEKTKGKGYKDKYGYINLNGEMVIPYKYTSAASFTGDGLAVVGIGDNVLKRDFGFIDKNGETVIPMKYNEVRPFEENGLAIVGVGEYGDRKYGFINRVGELVIPMKYNVVRPFGENGLAIVGIRNYSGKKYGCINQEGRTVLEFIYDELDPFYNGLSGAVKDGKLGFIDMTGNVMIPFEYEYRTIANDSYPYVYSMWPSDFRYGDATLVLKGGKWGLINKEGKALTEFVYDDIKSTSSDGPKLIKDGVVVYLDWYGNEYRTDNQRKKHPIVVDGKGLAIQWPFIPSSTPQQLFALKAQIKSDSKIAYCTVYLNGSPIAEDFAPGGSHVANDIKETDNYNFTISKTLALKDGKNTIRIKVGNAGGVTDESREITYTPIKQPVAKPAIAWGDIPERTTSSKLVVTAEVTSESAIASCDLYLERNCDGTKGSHIAPDIIEGQEKGKLSKTMSRTFTLCEGENNIVAEATNAAGMTKVVKKVTYEKPEPPAIAWDGIAPENTTKETLEVKATINSKTDVSWKITKSSSGKTKGSRVAADIIENVVASGTGNSVNGQVTLSPGYNTITIEATNAYERETVSKKVWYSPCEKRIALVIGNKNYKGRNKGGFDPLNKTLNDADTIAKLLKNECGFDVIKVENANHRVMEDTINEFINRVKYNGYKTAFVYYSGHGASYDRQEGDNYLIPIDCADCTDSIKARGIEVRTRILQRLEKEIGGSCPVKIAMLDCCRTYRVTHCSPLPGANGGTRGSDDMVGLSEMKLPEGVAVLYGAEFDHPSYDGIGANSPFVECFVKYVREHPKSNWRDLGFEVRKMVSEMTKDYVNPYTQKPDPQKPYPDIFKFSNADKFYLNPYHDKP